MCIYIYIYIHMLQTPRLHRGNSPIGALPCLAETRGLAKMSRTLTFDAERKTAFLEAPFDALTEKNT